MTCRDVAEFLLGYLSDELPAEARTAFERHLAACPNCRNYLATYRATVALAERAYPAEADPRTEFPEELVQAILASCRR